MDDLDDACPVARLVRDIEREGRNGADPVGVAWAAATDPSAMMPLLVYVVGYGWTLGATRSQWHGLVAPARGPRSHRGEHRLVFRLGDRDDRAEAVLWARSNFASPTFDEVVESVAMDPLPF